MPDKEDDKIQTTIGQVASEVWDAMLDGIDEMPVETHHLETADAEESAGDKEDKTDTKVNLSSEQSDDQKTDVEEQPEEKAEQPGSSDEKPVEAPQHWPEADRAMFASQPKEVKQFLLDRHHKMEADYTRKTQAAAESIRLSESVVSRIDPVVAQDMKAKGVTPEKFLTTLVDWHKLSMKDPEAFARQVITNLKIDPRSLAEDYKPDPVESRIAAIESDLQAREAARVRSLQESAASTLRDFAEEKDAGGEPLRPHLDKVRNFMGRLMMADDSLDLSAAYELAVYRDPELRKTLTGTATEQPKVAQSQPDTQRIKDAQRAARASSANIRGSGRGVGRTNADSQKPMSLKDALRSAADEVGLN